MERDKVVTLFTEYLNTVPGQDSRTVVHSQEVYNLVQSKVVEFVADVTNSPERWSTLRTQMAEWMLEFGVTTPEGNTQWYYHDREWAEFFLYITNGILELTEKELEELESGTGLWDDGADDNLPMLRLLNCQTTFQDKFLDAGLLPKSAKVFENLNVNLESLPHDLLTMWMSSKSFLVASIMRIGIQIEDQIKGDLPQLTGFELRRMILQAGYLAINSLVLKLSYDTQLSNLMTVIVPAGMYDILMYVESDLEQPKKLAVKCLSIYDERAYDTVIAVRSVIGHISMLMDDAIYSMLMDDVFYLLSRTKEIILESNGELPTYLLSFDFDRCADIPEFFRLHGLNFLEFVLIYYPRALVVAMRDYYRNVDAKVLNLSSACARDFAQITEDEILDTVSVYAGWSLFAVFFEYTLKNIKIQNKSALHTMLYAAGIQTDLGFKCVSEGDYYSGYEVVDSLVGSGRRKKQQSQENVFQLFLDDMEE